MVVIIDTHQSLEVHHGNRSSLSVRPQPSGEATQEFRFTGTDVGVRHFGNGVLLLPLDNPWDTLEAALSAFEPGFVLAREQPPQQVRPEISA